MRCTLTFLLLSALCLAACSKPPSPDAGNAPANTPALVKPAAPLERAYVVSCAPTGDARDLQWFESGKEQPFPGDALKAHIENLAKAGGNWNAAKKLSENRVALRIDVRAPISEFWRFIDALAAAGVYKFALAMLQEFDPPFSVAGGGEPMWDLDARYLLLQLPVEGAAPRESKDPEFSLGLNLTWRKQFSRCLLSTNFQRETLPITEVEEVFSELLPVVAEGKRFKRVDQGAYSFAAKLTEEALGKAARRVKGRLTMVQIGEGLDAASKHRAEPGEHANMAYMFLALDAVARFNEGLAAEGKPRVEIQFAAGAGRGQFLTKLPDTPKPTEENKPRPRVEPWGDEPGELFEPKSAFTVTIEKLEQPAADGAKFAYFWDQSPKPRGLSDFTEEIASYAKHRDVRGGLPGWDSTKKTSRNVLAIRCDIEAPYSKLLALMEQAIDCGMNRFALAARGSFDESDYTPDGRSNRPLLTILSEQYTRFDINEDGRSAIPKEQITIYTDFDRETRLAQFVIAIGARGRKVVENSRCTLAEISSDLASDDSGRKAAEENRVRLKEAIVSKIESYIEQSGAKIEKLELRSGGDARAGTSMFEAPCGFLLLQIEVANEVNARRKLQQRPALDIVVWDTQPVPPEPEMKPEEKVEYPKDEPPEEDPKDK